ncbi:MAG TPA: hypothetical protein VMT85_08965 [Thermoanaerobaculia bacterium]|nr:hypothetical protein [Thermoanaerobaculia bacterium]
MPQPQTPVAADPRPPSTRALFEAADPDLWDAMANALIEQDPWPDENEPDPLGGIPMRTYEVVEVRPGEGIRLEECSCFEEHPRYWIADPRAAELFLHGDVFALGWNDEETFVWPPERHSPGIPVA